MTANQGTVFTCCFILGGLLYQLGRFLLGMAPTWDAFFQVSLLGIVVIVGVRVWCQFRRNETKGSKEQ